MEDFLRMLFVLFMSFLTTVFLALILNVILSWLFPQWRECKPEKDKPGTDLKKKKWKYKDGNYFHHYYRLLEDIPESKKLTPSDFAKLGYDGVSSSDYPPEVKAKVRWIMTHLAVKNKNLFGSMTYEDYCNAYYHQWAGDIKQEDYLNTEDFEHFLIAREFCTSPKKAREFSSQYAVLYDKKSK